MMLKIINGSDRKQRMAVNILDTENGIKVAGSYINGWLLRINDRDVKRATEILVKEGIKTKGV